MGLTRLAMAVTVLAVVFLLAVTACGSSGTVTLVEGETAEVLAVDNAFDPEELTVAAGTEVTFVNAGRNEHNVTPEDDDAEWPIETEDFQPGDEGSYRFTEPGTYRYYCSIHGTLDAGQIGTIVVE